MTAPWKMRSFRLAEGPRPATSLRPDRFVLTVGSLLSLALLALSLAVGGSPIGGLAWVVLAFPGALAVYPLAGALGLRDAAALHAVVSVAAGVLWAYLVRAERDRLRRTSSHPRSSFTVRLLIVAAMLGLAFATLLPSFLGAREKQLTRACDGNYTALLVELTEAHDRILEHGREDGCGATTPAEVVACVVPRHAGETNPRDPREPAFVSAPGSPCQVQLRAKLPSYDDEIPPAGAPARTTGCLSDPFIEIAQRPATGTPVRTFALCIE